MKNFWQLAIFLFCALIFAQTTITKSTNDYISGNIVSEFNLNGVPDNSASGNNATFNNSGLTKGNSVTGTFSTPDAAEKTTFPGTTIKFADGNGNNLFYKSSPSDLQITGATVAGAVLNFSADNALFIKFPTVFNDSYTDNASGTTVYMGTTFLFEGTISTTADGAGTLLIGGQSLSNIIRLKTIQNYNLYSTFDPTYTNPVGSINSTIYTYYDDKNRYPLFTVTSGAATIPSQSINQTSNLAVGQESLFLGTANNSLQNKLQVYPNPVKDQLFFAGNLRNFDKVKIFNSEGRLVKSQNIKSDQIDVGNFPAGVYILQLSGKNKNVESITIIKK